MAIAKAIGDPLRASILRVLSQDSFGVGELGSVFDKAQPAISHHLKVLLDAGLVSRRKEGTSVFYQRAPAQTQVVSVLLGALDRDPLEPSLTRRVTQINRERDKRSQDFFNAHADALSAHQQLICEPGAYTEAVMQMVLNQPADARACALEVGPGKAQLLRALSPHFDNVTGVDNAAEVLRETRSGINRLKNVGLVECAFADLDARDAYDVVVAAMVVHHQASPAAFFQQAARLLAPEGRLVIAELCPHDQAWVRECCGDLWLGFDREQFGNWCTDAGLHIEHHQYFSQNNGFRFQVFSTVRTASQRSSSIGEPHAPARVNSTNSDLLTSSQSTRNRT